ncbi:MAG: YfiR/HmsC family protein [Cyclobacteriaceae bacterium]
MSRKFSILFFLLFLSGFLLAQKDEIRSKQRAIFIYNITKQVNWPNWDEFEEFTIAVLGKDPVLAELQKMEADGREVREKSLKVKEFLSVDDVRNVQLVYVHNRFNFDIGELLDKVSGENVLIVSEDYGFNESMINMIEIDNVFQFEVNKARLELEKFDISRSFANLAISSAEKWQELYLKSSESLERAKEKVAEQQALLNTQQQQLDFQKSRIEAQIRQIEVRNKEFRDLRAEYERLKEQNAEQDRLFAEKEVAIKEAEAQLLRQQKERKDRQEEIERMDRILQQQADQLSNQESKIDEQGIVLGKQKTELNNQRNFTILFIVLTITTITAGFFIWVNYRIKKKAHIELEIKNEAIEAQSRELAAQNQEMEQFAYVASHDLQEPLNTIASIVNLVKVEKLDEVDKKSIGFIGESTSRMRMLIRGLLEYSQLGKNVEFKRVSCNKVIENVTSDLAKVIQDTGTVLKAGKLPVVQAHEVELTLLFQNLISNAIKFRKADITPEIEIKAKKKETKPNDKYWEFSISDNGIGIEEKFLEKIFIIFKRLHAKSAYQGTGIGLAHCKKIVDLHGGNIWVESEPDRGSTFYFTIVG